MAEMKKVEIGFIGHQVLTLRLTQEALGELRQRLADGGWMTVESEEGEVDLDLGKVAFVSVASGGTAVGFTGG